MFVLTEMANADRLAFITDRQLLYSYERGTVLLIPNISRIHLLSGCKVRQTLDRQAINGPFY